MNNGLISSRYAKALLASAIEKKNEDAVYADMCILNKAFLSVPLLKAAIANPTITNKDKGSLLKTACGDKISESTKNFIDFVIEQQREEFMQYIALMFEQFYRKEKKIIVSCITSAIQLPEELQKSIEKFITKTFDAKTVELRTELNSDIIGGYILDVEENRLDASIKGQLSKLYKYAKH